LLSLIAYLAISLKFELSIKYTCFAPHLAAYNPKIPIPQLI